MGTSMLRYYLSRSTSYVRRSSTGGWRGAFEHPGQVSLLESFSQSAGPLFPLRSAACSESARGLCAPPSDTTTRPPPPLLFDIAPPCTHNTTCTLFGILYRCTARSGPARARRILRRPHCRHLLCEVADNLDVAVPGDRRKGAAAPRLGPRGVREEHAAPCHRPARPLPWDAGRRGLVSCAAAPSVPCLPWPRLGQVVPDAAALGSAGPPSAPAVQRGGRLSPAPRAPARERTSHDVLLYVCVHQHTHVP